ncbi:hypothetical protein AAFF_G00079340 [Aldrovandia affinis]|uniref:G-protein coupled receptors family 1 profile domain-containing protein n=1 Tax=Aldrovandia affinis TaxID=143900 RepID=A0AAD7WCX5_9TELE|nr:hypothetical protein AAFF_G00079340 [Aldrovandia affinis]
MAKNSTTQNGTVGSSTTLRQVNKKVLIVQVLVGLFLYMNCLMIFTFFRKEAFRNTVRYILFAHTLVCDCLFLFLTNILFLLSYFCILMPVGLCLCISVVVSILTYATPLTLMAMSLERYVAICLPLRHVEISTPIKFGLSLIPVLFFIYINCVMLVTLKSKAAFQGVSRYILFGHMLFADSLQMIWSMVSYLIATAKVYMTNGLCVILLLLPSITLRIAPLNLAVMALERYAAICFPLRHAEISTMGIIVIYTYFAIMVAAKSVSSDKVKATKARNTVLLHLIQLGLCLSSFMVSESPDIRVER